VAPQPFRHPLGHLGRDGRQHDGELFPAQPPQQVDLPDTIPQNPNQMLQRKITRGMAIPIVDRLEVSTSSIRTVRSWPSCRTRSISRCPEAKNSARLKCR